MSQQLHELLITFRRQATDTMNTINAICRTLDIDAHGSHSKRIGVIQAIVCQHYEINVSAMMSRIRTKRYTEPRHLALFLARELTKHSLEDIAHAFRPDMDHGTVIHAVNAVTARLQCDPEFYATVGTIRTRCTEAIENITMPLFAYAKAQPE
jgi:chromosomal replication initiation ATPase DnaA